MSEPAAAVASPPNSKPLTRLGSFVLGPRVIDAQNRLGKIALIAVTGAPESPNAGMSGYAYCIPLGELPPNHLELAAAVLTRIRELNGPTLAPVLESGIAGRVGYVVEPMLPGERLADRLARERRFKPFTVASIIADVASALETAHASRVSHGMIVPSVIWVAESSPAKLGGFGLSGRGPALDQTMIAGLSYELLAGTPVIEDSAAALSIPEMIDRIRSRVHGLTEPLAEVIARGMAHDPAARFPSVAAYGQAFREAVTSSAIEICAGAWEAISRNDLPMAAILTEMASGYDPGSPEVPLLSVRIDGGTIHDLTSRGGLQSRPMPAPEPVDNLAPAIIDPQTKGAATFESAAQPGLRFDEAELRQLFGAADSETSTSRGNPWVIFLTVVFAMVALLTILAALAFARS